MNFLTMNNQPEFQIILPEHAAQFTQEVIRAYEQTAKNGKKKITHNVPTLWNVFMAYETFADPSIYGAGLLNKENDSADYYKSVKETMGPEQLAIMLRQMVMEKQTEKNTNQFDEMLWNDVFTVLQDQHICHSEIVREEEGRDVQVYYRNLPVLDLW